MMKWDDYEAIWKRQELPKGAEAELTEVKKSFESKSRKMERMLFIRDIAEASAGLLVCPVLVYMLWDLGPAAWPLVFSIILFLGITLLFIKERIRARKMRLGANASLLARVDADIAELRHQHRLFRNIGVWYFLPAIIAIVMGFWGIGRGAKTSIPPNLIWDLLKDPYASTLIIAMLVTFIGATYMAWKASRKSLQQQVEPRIEELEKLRADLLS